MSRARVSEPTSDIDRHGQSGKAATSGPDGFIDARPQAMVQRRIQSMADDSRNANWFGRQPEPGDGHEQGASFVDNRPTAIAQRQVQAMADHAARGQSQRTEAGTSTEVSQRANAMPAKLRQGGEALSGMSMAHVNVHYNSSKPAQLQALAYAQGNDIHLGPGQTHHLPHEAWHVVQQMQGRVAPTIQAKGIGINDDRDLEREADVMGARALSQSFDEAPSVTSPDISSDSTASRPDTGVHQLVKQDVVVTGVTHLVPIHGGSIFESETDEEVSHGHSLSIDIDDPIMSRRGPNQETEANRHEDRRGAQKYTWYPIYSEKASDYQTDGWPHLRGGTFVKADTPSASLPAEVRSEGLRERGAPTDAPPGTFDVLEVPAFMENQRNYQNDLAARFSMQSIMTSHRSVGFEYEFGQHNQGPEVLSHLHLAASQPFSNLFPLKFELETDSGAVIEIGMPPLLIPNAPDGGPDRARIKAADSKLKGVMKAMGAQHGPVAALLPLLEAQKLGRGWVAGPLLQHGGKYANMALQAPIAGKLQGGGVYSQLNITLTGEESARFISTVQKTMAPNSSESGVLGQAFQELEKLASSQPGTPLNATLLNKALANTLAIPSILLQRSRTIGKIPDELDLSSTVKELYSLWIKDSVPNMLATTLADPRALSAYAAKAADVIRGKVPGVMKPFRDLLLANDREAAAWKGLATYVAANSFYPKDYEEAESITQHVPAEKKLDILARAAEIRDMMVPGDSGEFKDTEEADGSGGGVQNRFDARLAAYKQLVATTCAAELAIREADITNAEKQVNDEITALLRLIGTPVVVTSAPTQFGIETFGSGTGVRKDTHVKHPETEKTSSGLRHSVAEVRSDPAMALFYSDLWDKKP